MLVRDDVDFADAQNCRKMTTLDHLIAASELTPAAVHEEIAAAFHMWEAAVNIGFREASKGERANILIGAQAAPQGWAFADISYDTTSTVRVKPISVSRICLNPEKRWKIGFDGDLTVYDLRYTLAHEIGHAIGLDHPVGAGQIMGISLRRALSLAAVWRCPRRRPALRRTLSDCGRGHFRKGGVSAN